MSIFIVALFIAIGFLVFAVHFQIRRRENRQKRLQSLELRPNCLLTRHPIVFIAGRRSIFRLFEHWNEVPAFLREHGYDVYVLEPAPRKPFGESMLEGLAEFPEKCHLIADSSLKSELESIARAKHPRVASLTLIQNPSGVSNRTRVKSRLQTLDLRPLENAIEVFEIREPDDFTPETHRERLVLFLLAAHNRLIAGRERVIDAIETASIEIRSAPWAIESRFLDLAISLAERDAQAWSE